MADKAAWDARNRMADGLDVRGGHAWDGIYKDCKAQFDAHPEYLVSLRPVKFRVSNPGLRKLVTEWALEKFRKEPGRDSVSLDPSDGDGWDNPQSPNPDATVYKSVTDRVVTLANEVAEAVNREYPGKYVVIYAYYKHSAPPTIRVHPNVAVGVTTAFSAGFEQNVTGWIKQGAKTIGIRDYYSVVVNHKDRPGGVPAGDPRAVAAAIASRHALNARFLSAEASDSWGPAGLGYYVASRMLWDTTIRTRRRSQRLL